MVAARHNFRHVLIHNISRCSFNSHFRLLWIVDICLLSPAQLLTCFHTSAVKEQVKNKWGVDSSDWLHIFHILSVAKKCNLSIVGNLSKTAIHIRKENFGGKAEFHTILDHIQSLPLQFEKVIGFGRGNCAFIIP